ncbi:hypothetical protein HUJ05_002559 [Dendroctonus ponderosae]|nr:hypothetical protein HUJ05_002559 [Dendroctonus ponderosae]
MMVVLESASAMLAAASNQYLQPDYMGSSSGTLNNQTEQEVVERGTFSRWLSSEEGLENLKLFVFMNTLLCFVLVC